MKNSNFLCLCFRSNLRNYQIKITDGKQISCVIMNNFESWIIIENKPSFLQIVATPLKQGYLNKLIFNLDTLCLNEMNLGLQFFKNPPPLLQGYSFRLLDKNYGLKLNGNLFFERIQ